MYKVQACTDDNLEICGRSTIHWSNICKRWLVQNYQLTLWLLLVQEQYLLKDLSYDTFVSVAQEQDFFIPNCKR